MELFEWMAQATTKCDLFSRINQSFQWNTYSCRFNLRARSLHIFLTIRLCLNFKPLTRLWYISVVSWKIQFWEPAACATFSFFVLEIHSCELQEISPHSFPLGALQTWIFSANSFCKLSICEKCKNRIECIELVVIILLIFNILNINQQNHDTRNYNEQINVNMTSDFNYKLFIQCIIFLLIIISWIVYNYVNIRWPFLVQSNQVANCECANYYILHCTSALQLHYLPPVFVKDSAAW